MKKALYSYAKDSKLTADAWDEQVVNNIKIKKIHLLPDEMDDEDFDDAINFVTKHTIEHIKWGNTVNLQSHIAGITGK